MRITPAVALSFLREYLRDEEGFDGVWLDESSKEPWRLSMSRGLGRDIDLAVLSIDERLAATDPGKCLELLTHQARQARWLWGRPSGLVVGVAGKWRKWGRAA